MSATIKSVNSDSPLANIGVSVDGSSPVMTNSSGVAAVAAGSVFDLGTYGKIKYRSPETAAEIWIDDSSSGGGGVNNPPPPPIPPMPPLSPMP